MITVDNIIELWTCYYQIEMKHQASDKEEDYYNIEEKEIIHDILNNEVVAIKPGYGYDDITIVIDYDKKIYDKYFKEEEQ